MNQDCFISDFQMTNRITYAVLNLRWRTIVFHKLLLVRSLSGKDWQDRDKADKVSISFSRDS